MLGIRNPGEMSDREIFEEVAAILARGYLRLKRRSPAEAGTVAGGTPPTANGAETLADLREGGLDVSGE